MIKNLFSWLVFFGLIIAGIYFLIKSKGEASEYFYAMPIEHEFHFQHYQARTRYEDHHVTPENKQKWQQEFEFHMYHAKRTYDEAKNCCWYLPNLSSREKARYCFISAVAMIGSSTPQGRLVAAVVTLLSQHGLDAMDEWHYVNEKLYWSQYHFDLCDFYASLLTGKKI